MRATAIFGLLVGLCLCQSARAELVWDRTNLVSDRGGLVAVLADPDDGRVAWAASETRVWVTDDGGDAWYLVAQIHGERRTQAADPSEDEEDEDFELTDEDDEQDEQDELDDTEVTYDYDSLAPVEDVEEPDTDSDTSRTRSTSAEIVTPPVIRLRLVAGQVFLTGDRGLWAIDREARALGTAVEVRLRRAMAVRDIVASPWGSVLLATNQGLREIDDSGSVRPPSRGALGDRDVACLAVNGGVVVAATEEGLWRVEPSGSNRMGLVGVSRPKELLSLPDRRLAVATATELLFVDLHVEQVTHRWPHARIERLARDRSGGVWAVGQEGAWNLVSSDTGIKETDTGWQRQTYGLGDRRLTDVACPPTGSGHVFVVGRGGVWRRVPERVWLAHQRERLADVEVEEGAPPVWELLEAAHVAHHSTEARIDGMYRVGQWAFILPEVRLEYQHRQRREVDLVDVPEFDQDLVTRLRIYPAGSYFKVHAFWDVYPVVWAFFEGNNPYTGPTAIQERLRAMAVRDQVRSAVVGLYNLWIQKRRAWREGTPPSTDQALKAILSMQQIEADLHVLTGGSFTSMTTLDSISKGGNP